MSPTLQAEIIGEAGRLAALRGAWEDLWRRSAQATPFQSPDWLIPWWNRFHPGELFTAAVWCQERLVGLAPAYLEDGAYGRRILPLGISVSDYLDVLLDPAQAGAAGAALVACLAGAGSRWDVWELEELPPGAASLALPAPEGCADHVFGQSACPVLRLPEAADDLDACIPKGRRRKLRMARHRAARRGLTLVSVGAGELDAFLADLIRLHGLRWEARGESGLLADDRLALFLVDTARNFVPAGLARLYAVRIGGETVGAYYGFRHGAGAYAYFSGFDPAYAHESPGAILVGHAIEEAVREGAAEFHLLRGRESYKYEWGAVDRWNQHRRFVKAEAPGAG